jgi:glutathione synthase/RimK-type ligase-like ATP-grasp enzyme
MKVTVAGKGEDARNIAEGLACKRFAFKSATDGIIIRYGNVRTVNRKGYEAHPRYEINTIKAINNARDKFKSLKMMEEGGCRVPKAVEQTPVIGNGANETWFARKKFHHKGLDIVVCKTNRELETAAVNGSEYFVKYIPIGKEYRYHVFGDKILQACIKFKEAGNGGVGTDEDIIRNLDHGWKFAEIEPQPKASEYAIKACRALGLHFGAVDIIEEQGHTLLYVLEVNTAAGLDNKRLETYINAFKNYIEEVSAPAVPNEVKVAKVKYPEWFSALANELNDEYVRTTMEEELTRIIKVYLEHVNA